MTKLTRDGRTGPLTTVRHGTIPVQEGLSMSQGVAFTIRDLNDAAQPTPRWTATACSWPATCGTPM